MNFVNLFIKKSIILGDKLLTVSFEFFFLKGFERDLTNYKLRQREIERRKKKISYNYKQDQYKI